MDLRRSHLVGPVQEGVYAATDYQVTQRTAGGAALFVDIAAGAGAFACVQGDALTGQGLYVVAPHSAAVITEAIATPNVSNPRIDIAVLEVFDNALDASGLNIARVRIIAGTPTAGTTLTSRAGVAALPGSALLLADILVTAGATTVSNTQIRDRRKWARGANVEFVLAGLSSTPGQDVWTNVGGSQRIECSGVALAASVDAAIGSGTASGKVSLRIQMDGVNYDGMGDLRWVNVDDPTTNYQYSLCRRGVPAAGSHVFQVQAKHSTTSAILVAEGKLSLEESVRQNANNSTITSG